MVVSGQRLSEQPTQRIVGDWPVAREGRRSGFLFVIFSRQWALESRTLVKEEESVRGRRLVWGEYGGERGEVGLGLRGWR